MRIQEFETYLKPKTSASLILAFQRQQFSDYTLVFSTCLNSNELLGFTFFSLIIGKTNILGVSFYAWNQRERRSKTQDFKQIINYENIGVIIFHPLLEVHNNNISIP